jgi:hypothetical protein
MEFDLKNISLETAEKVAQFLEAIDYNEPYIYHFLQEADEKENPVEYIKNKFPNIEL